MNSQLDEDLFEIFSSSFYGYGTYRAPLWFVGPYATLLGREGDEAARRLELWHRRGQPQLVDLPRFLTMLGEDDWFGENARLHRVWSKLARVALATSGRSADANVRTYQSDVLGSDAGASAVLHLLPVEFRTESPWPYASLDTAHLRKPDLYLERFGRSRARHIARLVQRHEPAVVVFYDLTHRTWWRQIAGAEFEDTSERNCFAARLGSTRFVIMRHPESVGTRNDYFDRVGRLIGGLLPTADTASLPVPDDSGSDAPS